MGVPDHLRTQSSGTKRAVGACYILVAAVIALLSWGILGAGFDGTFGLDGSETLDRSNREIRGSALLLVLPGILIAMFLFLGLKMLITGRVGGERRVDARPEPIDAPT